MTEQTPTLSDEDIRIVQAMADFQMALSAVDFLCELDEDAQITRVERRRYRCFEDEAVISYCRPFTSSNGLRKLTFEQLGVSPSEEEAELHQRLRVRRDKVIAHTDVAQMRLAISSRKIFDDDTIMMPHFDFDDALAFFCDRWKLMEWLHKLMEAGSKRIFDNAQKVGAFKYIRDHTLSK